MSTSSNRLWPFRLALAVFLVPIVLAVLLALVASLRSTIGWPTDESERYVFIGIFVFSLLPPALALADILLERGAIIQYGNLKLDFSAASFLAEPAKLVPGNIGVPSLPVGDSNTSEILAALRDAAKVEVVVVDLEDGKAWWETRLLILMAGATRLGRPDAVVFVATDRGVEGRYQGWGKPKELLRCLLNSDVQYQRCFLTASALTRQWELVAPGPSDPPMPPSAVQSWMTAEAKQRSNLIFDHASGLPKEFWPELVLASELGAKIEQTTGPKPVSITQFEALFRPVLHGESIDDNWPDDQQRKVFLEGSDSYIAATKNGRYERLFTRMTALNAIVKGSVTATTRRTAPREKES